MNKFEKYFSNKKHFIKEDLKNTYIVYKTSDSRHFLLSDSYSIIMVNDIPDTFKENKKYSSSIIPMFERFIDKNNINKVDTYYIDFIKDNVNNDNEYFFDNEYGVDYYMLKKIVGVIGGNKINVIRNNNIYHPIIELVGRNGQVAYLLPIHKSIYK